jgi:hypothetical protein
MDGRREIQALIQLCASQKPTLFGAVLELSARCSRPDAAKEDSPGRRPAENGLEKNPALKGRNRFALSGLVIPGICYPGLRSGLSNFAPLEQLHPDRRFIHQTD